MRSNGSRGSNGQGEEPDDDVDDRDGDAEDADAKPRRRWRRTILEWLGVIGGGIAIALLVEAFLIQAFWIPSPSMEPTLDVGDRVLVNKLSYRFHDVNRGDVVVFERPPGASTGQNDEIKDLIKRVVAVGGDTIEAKEGDVYVNGGRIDEDYLEPGTPTDNLPLTTIPDGHVFVMGDNRTNSEDSRIFGPIDEDADRRPGLHPRPAHHQHRLAMTGLTARVPTLGDAAAEDEQGVGWTVTTSRGH